MRNWNFGLIRQLLGRARFICNMAAQEMAMRNFIMGNEVEEEILRYDEEEYQKIWDKKPWKKE